jgi:hypothetical protein
MKNQLFLIGVITLSANAMAETNMWRCTQDVPKYARKVVVEISDETARVEWHGKTCDLPQDPDYWPTTYKDYRRFNAEDPRACGKIFTLEGGITNVWLASLRIAFSGESPNPRKTVFFDMQPSDGFNFTWNFRCQKGRRQ